MTHPYRRSILVAALLTAAAAPAQKRAVHLFEKRQLSDVFYCEGASFGDLDHDGKSDIVSGPFWWKGPEFEERRRIYEQKPFDTARYSNNFFAFVHDIDADDWNDVLVIGFPGKDASWFQNPKGDGEWKRHVVFDVVDNESPTFEDLTGDGKPELICQFEDRLGYAAPDWDDPTAKWTWHPLSPTGYGGRFTHGLGIGDVNGDGRKDVLWRHGWFEQPESLSDDPQWSYHPVQFAGRGGAQMYAYDVDGDGDNDVITSVNAHGYGLFWYENRAADDKIKFVPHKIMGEKPDENPYGVAVGNLHAIDLIDMNGDGLLDIVTGNRYWAHGGNDPADRKKPYLHWFELVRTKTAESGAQFVPHEIDDDSGVGTQVVAGDIDGDGLADVVVGNKKGTFVHLHRLGEDKQPRERRAARAAEIVRLRSGAAQDPGGVVPVDGSGRKLNLGFESGDLSDWEAAGAAFEQQPNRGDTVRPRRADSRSQHAGEYWIGTYEVQKSDASKGTLTSVPFVVAHDYASMLVGGGQWRETRVEIVRVEGDEVIRVFAGRNREEMRRRFVDLRRHRGEQIRIRIVDEHTGHWGHVNFDDFRFHPRLPAGADVAEMSPSEQPRGLTGLEAARQMTVPDGFSVTLCVSEPDVHQPIAFTIDGKGRLWVAEAHAYPKKREAGAGADKIIVFADADGDGAYEQRTEFLGGLNLVSGLEVGFGGVWVGQAPELLFIPDADDDLKPDGPPQVLLDGFGYQDTHETLNAFNWGPDGWLYGCHGVFTHSRVGKPGTADEDREPMNAAVWRYHPKRHEFEVFAWGVSNQWGVDFDDHGQAIITACVIPHLYHVIQGGRYQRQANRHFNPYVFDDIKTIADHLHYLGATPHSGNGVSNSVGGGHAHCGAMVYLGDSFPPEYRNRVFMNNIHGNRVNVDVLEPEGSGFIGRHGDDFLLANDAWFRGIALRYGPDGSVFVSDWYDEQACHLRNPEIWDRSNGRIYKISYGDNQPGAVDVASLSDDELVRLQRHENDWWVRAARQQLAHKGSSAAATRQLIAMLRQQSADPRHRLRAMWTLHATGGLGEELVLEQLGSDEEYLRAWAVQLELEDRTVSARVMKRLAALARNDASPVVRKYLASALQRLPLVQRWDIAGGLLSRGEDQDDHNLPLLYWYGVEPLVPADPQRAMRLARTSRIPLVTRFIVRRMASGADAHLDPIVAALGDSTMSGQHAMVLGELTAALERFPDTKMPGSWPKVFARLAKSSDAQVRDKALGVALVFGDASAIPQLRDLVIDRGVAIERRRLALDGLLRSNDAGNVAVLLNLLQDRQMRERAIAALARFDDPRTPPALLARWSASSRAERDAIVATMTSRPAWARSFLQAIVDGAVDPSALDGATTRRQIAGFQDAALDHLVNTAWGRSVAVSADKRDEIERYKRKLTKEVLAGANLPSGRAVFAKTCMVCHKLFGIGADLGPDITGSNRKDLDYILTNIIDPSAEVAKDYMMTVVRMSDGRYVSGVIADRSAATITIRNQNETEILRLSDVAKGSDGRHSIVTSPVSMMPIGQHLALSDDEFRDLIGYLASPQQVPMAATEGDAARFFNGRDLTGWDADPAIWSVIDGAIVGRSEVGLARNDFAKSQLALSDFRLVCEIKLEPNTANSGIQFRSQPIENGQMRGYQADAGAGWWGKLYEEHGRAVLWDRSGEQHVRPSEWNTYEILAIGHRIRTAINGKPCVDLEDPDGALAGIIGLQLHSGGPTVVRFRGLTIEIDPEPELETVGSDRR